MFSQWKVCMFFQVYISPLKLTVHELLQLLYNNSWTICRSNQQSEGALKKKRWTSQFSATWLVRLTVTKWPAKWHHKEESIKFLSFRPSPSREAWVLKEEMETTRLLPSKTPMTSSPPTPKRQRARQRRPWRPHTWTLSQGPERTAWHVEAAAVAAPRRETICQGGALRP